MGRLVRRFLVAMLAVSATSLASVGCARQPSIGGVGTPPPWIRTVPSGRPLGGNELAVRWYGTAGFAVRSARTTLYFDPYFTRDPAWKLAFAPAVARPEKWPADLARPDAIFIGHAHFDHYLDAPAFARKTGARLHASEEALRVARAEGTPDGLLRPIAGGDTVSVGDLLVEVATSSHSDIITQAFDGGSMPARPRTPMWFLSYKNGPVFNFLVRFRGRSVAHISSAQIRDEFLEGRKADLALVCLSGWRWTPTYFARIYETLGPDAIIPMHHDDFFRPLSEDFVEGPVAAVSDAYRQIQQEMPGTAILPIAFFQEYRITGLEGGR